MIAITESWLTDFITDAQISIDGYVPLRSDRTKRNGGGTLLYVQEDLPFSEVQRFDDSICEVICSNS